MRGSLITACAAAALALAAPGFAAQELCPASARRPLRASVRHVAGTGRMDLVRELEGILVALGDTDEELDPAREAWAKAAARARSPVKPRALASAAKKLGRGLAPLEKLLDAGAPEAEALARLVLAIDSESSAAHDALGHIVVDGRHVSAAEVAIGEGTAALEDAVRRARELEIEAEVTTPSTSAFVRGLYGEASHTVKLAGIQIHGGIPPERLGRSARGALRAMAFSRWVRGKSLEPPRSSRLEFLFTGNEAEFQRALDAAEGAGKIDDEFLAFARATGVSNVQLRSGMQLMRWCPDPEVAAQVLWFAARKDLGKAVQPWVFAGHVHWLCLEFLGTAKPGANWLESPAEDGRTVAAGVGPDGPYWRAAARGLFGARSYVKRRLERGEPVSLVDSIRDEPGSLTPVQLLVATLAVEHLMVAGRFPAAARSKRVKDGEHVAATEALLDQSIPELDLDWTWWLRTGGARPGVVQRMSAVESRGREPMSSAEKAALGALRAVRRRAFEPLNLWSEELEHYAELSAGARAHAAYLRAHPERSGAWPDAHTESPEHPEWTPHGARAGRNSVIGAGKDIEGAIDGWMGTFFHRLPLLEPGLIGFGVAMDQGVVLLDASSMMTVCAEHAMVAWPPADAEGVPRRFQPELPNPVPGEDQSAWGYPITVQAYARNEGHTPEVTLRLVLDGSGQEVDCHFLSPTAPRFPELVPDNAFCLIPKGHLRGGTRYRVEARELGPDGRAWSWVFTTD